MKSKVPFVSPIYDVTAHGGGGGDALVHSNGTRLLSYYERLGCKGRDKLDDATFKLFVNGSLFRSTKVDYLPAAQYCLENHEPPDRPGVYILEAYVCRADGVPGVPGGVGGGGSGDGGAAGDAGLSVEDTKGSWKYTVMLVGFVPSIVCLALTLLVYAMLSSLRNVHGYYVMCYVACLLMSFVCLLVIQWMTDIIDSVLCKLFGMYIVYLCIAGIAAAGVKCHPCDRKK